MYIFKATGCCDVLDCQQTQTITPQEEAFTAAAPTSPTSDNQSLGTNSGLINNMSDTAAGADGGGVAGAGQDEGADNEPPRQALLLGTDSSEVGEMSEEGAPPSAKRTKMTEEDQEQEPFAETAEMCGETLEEPGSCLHEDISSFEQSMYNCSNKIRDAWCKSG